MTFRNLGVMMKRLTLVAALAALAIMGGFGGTAVAEETSSGAVSMAATPTDAAADASTVFAEPEPSFFESTDATCEDFGFFAADKKADCDKSCKKGNKCQRKQVCGDGQCPPPGYCWKCPN
jgi:hypothetical protein